MTYKGASILVLFWGIFNLLSGGIAYYFMGSHARSILVLGALAGILGCSIGHFLNRGRRQTFILALGSCILFVFLLGRLTSIAFQQKQNLLFSDALATHSQDITFLVSLAMLTCTILVLLLLLAFTKPIYNGLRREA